MELWTEDSHAELARAHCAPVLWVISPIGCSVISESSVCTGLTHCHSMDFAVCLKLPRGQNKLICTYEHIQVWEPRAGHILARKTLGMSPLSEFIFFSFIWNFFYRLDFRLGTNPSNHDCTSIILFTIRVFHSFNQNLWNISCVPEKWVNIQGMVMSCESQPLSLWSSGLAKEAIMNSMTMQIST